MTFGARVWDADGTLVLDTRFAAGGVPIGVWSGTSPDQTLHFPEWAGRTMQALCIDGDEFITSGTGVTFSYGTGYPVAAVPADSPTFLLAVF